MSEPPTSAPLVSFDRWPYPRRAAHRGAGRLAPENTLAALRLGAAHGYRMVEVDVQLSADGQPFLLHDATLERTTDGRGEADAATLAELERLDAGSWHGPAHAGEPVPTLAAVAAWACAHGVAVDLEIKPAPGRSRAAGAAIATAAACAWRGEPVPPLLSSFDDAALAGARDARPDLPRALLFDRDDGDWIARARALGCVAIGVHDPLLSRATAASIRKAGLRLLAYTVNDAARAARLADWGVDCVITDAIDRIAA